MSVILVNTSAFGTFRFSWAGCDGVQCEIQWGQGMSAPLAFRHNFPVEVKHAERFGFDPAKAGKSGRAGLSHFKAFVQRFADEFDAGVAEDLAEEAEEDTP
jgi:hypothetical protein